jgi:hypothetical protein
LSHSIPGFWVAANIPHICFQFSRLCWRPSPKPNGKEKWHGQSLQIRREEERNMYSVKSCKHYSLYLHRLVCCTCILFSTNMKATEDAWRVSQSSGLKEMVMAAPENYTWYLFRWLAYLVRTLRNLLRWLHRRRTKQVNKIKATVWSIRHFP